MKVKAFIAILDVFAMLHIADGQHVYSGKEIEKLTGTLSGLYVIILSTVASAPEKRTKSNHINDATKSNKRQSLSETYREKIPCN